MKFSVELKELMKKYGLNIVRRELSIYYDNACNNIICNNIHSNDNSGLKKFVKHNNIVIWLDDDLFKVMNLANKMVKDKTGCTGRLRNRFYSLKHSVLKRSKEIGLVDEIIDNGDYYLFIINGYSFHQPKSFYKNTEINVNKFEPYTQSQNSITFDYETYKLAMSTMAYFISIPISQYVDNVIKSSDRMKQEIKTKSTNSFS